jgi:hypothetical protein
VSAETKLELLGLIDRAVADGWAHRRACEVLDLADVRAHRWRARLRETGSLEDRDPGGGAVHGILSWEEAEILDLIEEWGQIDRSHRKLAHRGSRLGVVFVSPSTVLRVALKHKVHLPGEPYRPRPKTPVLPEIPWERNRIWIWDAVRREALWSRAVMKGHRGRFVAADRGKLRAACPAGTGGNGWEAALTTTGRASTARWSGSGKRDGTVNTRNQRQNAPQEDPPAQIWQMRAGPHRAPVAVGGGELPGRLASPVGEAIGKVCGVPVAMVQGHSWSPRLSSGSMVNAGTILPVPLLSGMMLAGGKARRRLMPAGWDGGLVVVAGATTGHGGRESRPQGEGVQPVRSRHLRWGGRW